MHVIYHDKCYDGWGAAWVASHADPFAVLVPGIYGKPIPAVPDGADVLMVDISYPRAEMEALAARVNLTVLDHHKTAQANLEGFPNCVFDMTKSGAMLAWEHFHRGCPPPQLVRYLQDQDLWNWELPRSREICSYIRSFPRDLESYDSLDMALDFNFQRCVEQGAAINRTENQRVEEICEQAFWVNIAGHDVPVVNASTHMSSVGNALCRMFPDAPFAAYYFDRADGVRQWGLRSIGEFDVSAVARTLGGGGHKNASGFQTDTRTYHPNEDDYVAGWYNFVGYTNARVV